MSVKINRVHEALLAWKQMEESNSNLFPPSVMGSPEFAKLRLKRLDEVAARLAPFATAEEKNSLNMLRIERRQLLAKAYPQGRGSGRIIFLLIRTFRFIFHRQLELRRQERQMALIRMQMQKAGLGRYVAGVLERIGQGARNFSLATAAQIRQNEQVHFNLKFSFDELKGHRFDSFQAVYRDMLHPGAPRQHTFPVEAGMDLDIRRAESLIAGRAVLEKGSAAGKEDQYWVKLDSRKDEHGDYLKKYIAPKNFDLGKLCSSLPFWKDMSAFAQLRTCESLVWGERAMVVTGYGGQSRQLYLEADPEKGLIRLLDEKGKTLEFSQAAAKARKPPFGLKQESSRGKARGAGRADVTRAKERKRSSKVSVRI